MAGTAHRAKRLLMGGILAIAIFAGIGSLQASPASAQSTTGVQVARCTKAITARSTISKANMADCRSAILVQLRCDSGTSIGIVKVKGVAYVLRQGSRPVRIGNNYRVAQLQKVCTSPAPTTTTTVTTTTVTVPPTTTTAPPPAPTTTPPTSPPATVPPPTSPPPTAAPVTACSPMTSSGNCYSAGEFCSNADHGVSGVAGNGEAITCEDNNGWRWEPS